MSEADAFADTIPAPAHLIPRKVVKACGCGRNYSRGEWRELPTPLGGRYMDDGFELLELRNCQCGSTLCVVLGPSPAACAVIRSGGR